MKSLTERYGRWLGPYAALWITLVVGGFLVVVLTLLSADLHDQLYRRRVCSMLRRPQTVIHPVLVGS